MNFVGNNLTILGVTGASGELTFSDGTNGLTIKGPTGMTGPYELSLPAVQGNESQALARLGSSETQWIDVMGNTYTTITAESANIDVTELYNTCYVKTDFNPEGIVDWVTRVGGPLGDTIGTDISNIATDGTNVYMVGQYHSSPGIVYNEDNTVFTTLPLTGFTNGFLAKYNPSGFGLWATRIYGGGNLLTTFRTVVSDGTDIYATAEYNPTLNIYNSDSSLFGTIVAGETAIIKYDSNGFSVWSTYFSSTRNIYIWGSSFISGNLYVVGSYGIDGNIYNVGGGLAFSLTNSNATGTGDGFIIKYNTSGIAQWIAEIKGATTNGDDQLKAVHGSGSDIYASGFYETNPVEVYNSDGSLFGTYSNPGGADRVGILIKYNDSGFVQWVVRFPCDVSHSLGNAVHVFGSDVYVSGRFSSSFSGSTLSIYNSDGSLAKNIINPLDGADGFLLKFNSAGFLQWNICVVSVTVEGREESWGIADDGTYLYFVGQYTGAPSRFIDSDSGTFLDLTATTPGTNDTFTAKLTTDGFFEWICDIKGSSTGFNYNVITLNSHIYTSGLFASDPITFYNSDGTIGQTEPRDGTEYEIFLARYSNTTSLTINLDDATQINYHKTIVSNTIIPVNVVVSNVIDPGDGTDKTTINLPNKGSSVTIRWDGTEWFVVASIGAITYS